MNERLNKKLDLKERFPGYFEPKIFRCAFIVLFLLLIIMFSMYGIKQSANLSCPDYARPCLNMLYYCEHPEAKPFDIVVYNCDDAKKLCHEYPALCDVEFIPPGETIGNSIPWLIKNYILLFIAVLALAFLLNDIRYRRKR